MEVVEVFFGWKELWPLGCLDAVMGLLSSDRHEGGCPSE